MAHQLATFLPLLDYCRVTLSPYLVLLVAEGLSRLLKGSENRSQFNGFQVLGVPLLFLTWCLQIIRSSFDDTIIFCGATLPETNNKIYFEIAWVNFRTMYQVFKVKFSYHQVFIADFGNNFWMCWIFLWFQKGVFNLECPSFGESISASCFNHL